MMWSARVPTCAAVSPPGGSPVKMVQPDGELYGAPSVHVTQYLPLGVRAFDENDTAAGAAAYPKEMFMDGLGRTVCHQRVAVAGGPALRTTATYDALGNISGITDALGHTRVQEHDLLGRVVRSTDPDTGTTTHVYDDNGNRTSNGAVTSTGLPLVRLTPVV